MALFLLQHTRRPMAEIDRCNLYVGIGVTLPVCRHNVCKKAVDPSIVVFRAIVFPDVASRSLFQQFFFMCFFSLPIVECASRLSLCPVCLSFMSVFLLSVSCLFFLSVLAAYLACLPVQSILSACLLVYGPLMRRLKDREVLLHSQILANRKLQ